LFEYGLRLELINMLLPLLWPSQVAEIGEEEVHVKVEVGMKVVRLHV